MQEAYLTERYYDINAFINTGESEDDDVGVSVINEDRNPTPRSSSLPPRKDRKAGGFLKETDKIKPEKFHTDRC